MSDRETALEAIEAALAASERKRWGDVPDRVAVAEWATEVHDHLVAAGLLLPAGTETVEQWGARVTRDGELFQEPDAPSTKGTVQARVDFHARKRAEEPGWRGDVVPVRRRRHTTPWEPVREQPPRQRRGLDGLLEELGDVRIQFWVCPVAGHSSRTDEAGRPAGTVEWRDDIAYCTAPGCGRNSQPTTAEERP